MGLAFIECMHCGDTFATVQESMEHACMISADDTEAFEEIWRQECRTRGARVQVLFTDRGAPLRVLESNARNLIAAQQELSRLVDQLSHDQMVRYGHYRLNILKEVGNARS